MHSHHNYASGYTVAPENSTPLSLDAFLSPDQPYIPEDLRVSLTFISSKLGRRKKRGTVVSAALNIEFNSSFSLFCSCGFPFGTETRKQNFHIFPAFVEVHARILVNLTFVPCVLHPFFGLAVRDSYGFILYTNV